MFVISPGLPNTSEHSFILFTQVRAEAGGDLFEHLLDRVPGIQSDFVVFFMQSWHNSSANNRRNSPVLNDDLFFVFLVYRTTPSATLTV
jgi:hypothetical protein